MSSRVQWRPSPNHDERPMPVDILLLHYTGMTQASAALDRLCDPVARVSAHYLIEEDGTLWQLVDEERRAWHAGVSHWAGATDINARSIGIELQNPGHEFGYRAFPEPQMQALIGLARGILRRHPIPAWRVIGHSDVAPTRKEDPGELFDWRRLADAGIGLWPMIDQKSAPDADWQTLLTAYGYDIADPAAALVAFQRHFQPDALGAPAGPETRRILAALLKAAGRTA
ncbi:MAG: N-acetylmuramoyl-L-alanine amidase [Rhodospirillaceae bacterium]|nr:N-acetylmuramoyl-L-alanine amidase [Rhodospirillaceae bacterium]